MCPLLRQRNSIGTPVVLGILATLAIGSWASGQEADPLGEADDTVAATLPEAAASVRMTGEAPAIDGVLEEIWIAGTLLPDTWRQVEPTEGGAPSQVTEVRLMRDQRNLYIGVRCFDDAADRIIARTLRRDGPIGEDDRIRIVLDPKRDRRTGYVFEMNPLGARGDGRLVNGRLDSDWDGIWDGRASIDDTGWTAEFVIPFRTISIDEDAEGWGINLERSIRRDNEIVRWASADRDIPFTSVADAAVVSMLGPIDQGSGIDVRPYGKFTYQDAEDRTYEGTGGVDVFWKVTPSLTFVGTVNPDFAETEVDQRIINFTRFNIRFPEKRDFFLEDAGYFNFGGIRSTPLPFYSRRIGLSPQGEPETILAGVKLTGSIEDVSLGLLDTQMTDDVGPVDKNYFAGRALVNVLEQSSVGVIATSGNPLDDRSNHLLGADFNYATSDLEGGRSLTGNAWFQQTITQGLDNADASAMGARIAYPNETVNARFGWARIGADYFPALGFVQRVGIHEFFGGASYRIRPESEAIRRLSFGLDGYLVTDLDFGTESLNLELDVPRIQFESGDTAFLEVGLQQEVPTEDFLVAGQLLVPAGNYVWERIEAGFETSSKNPLEVGGNAAYSGYYDGSRIELGGDARWQPDSSVLFGGRLQWNNIELSTGSLETWLASVQANLYFSPLVSWENLLQYDTQSGTVGLNSRFRWAFRDGQEIFLVFNQNVEADDLEFQVARSEFVAKIGWTFSF